MRTILLSILLLSSIEAKDFDFLLQVAYGTGGDTMVKRSGSDIHAGDGLETAVGIAFNPFELNMLDTTLTVGYSSSGSFLDDNYKVSKIPITLSEYYTYQEDWRFGAGITYHTSHKGDGASTDLPDLDVDDALGTLFSIGYLFGKEKKIQVALQVTLIDYKAEGMSWSGNRLALMLESRY